MESPIGRQQKYEDMINDRGIWMSQDETDTHTYDKILGQALVDVFKADVKTVIDIGCGNGEYTRNFINNGFDCMGYDGSPLTPKLSKGLCEIKDFSIPQSLGGFDLVLSLEVGEHIPVQYEQVFIDNVVNHARKYICISWAIEGQGGSGHVNCRNNDYVLAQFRDRGWKLISSWTDMLRRRCTFSWFHNTIMIFKKDE